MKRDPRLRDLSSEHHRALVLARELRSGGARPTALEAEFADAIEPHFRVEEEWLLPALEAAGEGELVRRTVEDHAHLRGRLALAAAGDEAAIRELADGLAAHVRFEERELFPRAEQVLDADALERVARACRVRLKRAYRPPADDDGARVLVERLWPRGVRKEALRLDAWARDVAPSAALRRWFGHDPARWDGFVAKYRAELQTEPAASEVEALAARAAKGPLTLVYGARDEEHNSAVVLRRFLLERPAGGGSSRG